MSLKLKRKLILTIDAEVGDYYEAIANNKIVKYGVKDVNNITLARIDMICETILKCLNSFNNKSNQTTPIYLTGGGLSYIKGIKDYLGKYLNHPVKIIAPTPLQFNKPELSSEISLLYCALFNIEN